MKVLTYFEDLADNGFKYFKGDDYPRNGLHPSAERIKELATAANKRGKPLICDDTNNDKAVANHVSCSHDYSPVQSLPEQSGKTDEKPPAKKQVKKLVKKPVKKPAKNTAKK